MASRDKGDCGVEAMKALLRAAIYLMIIAVAIFTIRQLSAQEAGGRFRDPRDGPGNWLWKPCSDHGCTLVVLFPSRHQPERFLRCRVFEPQEYGGFVRETLRYAGRSNPDRPTYRAKFHGAYYDGRIVCRRKRAAPGRVLLRLKVPDPAERQD